MVAYLVSWSGRPPAPAPPKPRHGASEKRAGAGESEGLYLPRNTLSARSTEPRQPSGASGRARIGCCCPRRAPAAHRRPALRGRASSSQWGCAAAPMDHSRHGLRSPPRRRVQSGRTERARSRTFMARSSRPARPPALVARRTSGSRAANRRRAPNPPGWLKSRALCEDLPSGTGSRVGTGMGTGQRAGELGAHTRVNRSRGSSLRRGEA